MQQPRTKNPSDPIQRAWVAIARVAPKLEARVEAELKGAGLPRLDWYTVLWGLEREGGLMRPRDLGEALFLTRYNVSRLIDRMEAEDLVVRRECPEDARGHLLELTAKGRALRQRMWAIYGPAMDAAMAPLSDAEADQLKALLDKLG